MTTLEQTLEKLQKQIEMEESDPSKARKEYDNVREEVKILRELDHINVVQ